MTLKLYTYWRSSAAHRVRIALEIKGVAAEQHPVQLVHGGGEQHRPAYRAIHPGGTVPALVLDDGTVITQSLAIIALLDELYPQLPLLPATPIERARVRAAAELIACDIHPIDNLRVRQYLARDPRARPGGGGDLDAPLDARRAGGLSGPDRAADAVLLLR